MFKGIGIGTAVIAGILATIVLCIVIVAAAWGFGVVTADIFGRGEAHKTIHQAQYRITAYNHFFDLCASVQANEAQIVVLEEEKIQYAPDGKDYARTLSNITGVTAMRQRSIAQYNADASKDYTIGQFRDSGLPYQLDARERKTICIAGD